MNSITNLEQASLGMRVMVYTVSAFAVSDEPCQSIQVWLDEIKLRLGIPPSSRS